MRTVTNTVRKGNNGFFLVAFTDGLNDVAFYDKTLDAVIQSLTKQVPYREIKEISWVEEIA